MQAIKVSQLKKYFGETKAVNDINFEVQQGEVFGFLGPNGAGKTTTIRCLMDFIRPTEGEIKIFGLDSQASSVELKQKIGYLPADVQLHYEWNGWDHINFIADSKGNRDTENIKDLIHRLDYNPATKVKQLSTGNKQKLGIIMSLIADPKMLLLDEPTRGLDPLLQNEIYKILDTFKKNGGTIFMSSHNLPEVERICDRVAIIKDGQLARVASIDEIKEARIHLINVFFADHFKASDFEGKNIQIISELHNGLSLKVKGDINPLMKKISTHEVKDLEINHATLEDVFMEFYR